MEKAERPELRPPNRTAWLIAALLLVGGALALRLALLPPPRPPDDSLPGLLQRLGGEEEDSILAQEVLERRVGVRDTAFWKRVLDSPSPRARYLAADSLAKQRTPEAARLLSALLEDYASEVRRFAVDAIVQTDRASALKPLLAALRDEDTWVRHSAATQLRYLQDRRTVPALLAALRDPDRATAMLAMSNLRALTGQAFRARFRDSPADFQKTVRRWETWWERARARWPVDPALASVAPVHPTRRAPAPDFDVTTLEGNRLRLSALRGRIVLLNFWGTWCGPCVAEVPILEQIQRRYRRDGLEVIGLGIGEESAEAVRRFAARHGLTYALALATERMREEYGHIHEVPVSFLIDRQGQIRYRWDGDRDAQTFSSAIRRLLAEP